jgi:hypothetical protein
MSRTNLEVADVFRRHGEAWRMANAGHVSLAQRRVMTAIEICRTAALGGHVERCQDCAQTRIAYNSCRNRHCPKCQSRSAAAWLAARKAELLPVPYFHFVFTLPTAIGAMAYQNKAKVYGLLLKTAAETLITIAADRKHLGAEIGIIAVLHTWGQNLQHHPHVHCIVPGGGISTDGKRWVASRPRFFLPVRVLSRLFRRLFLEGLMVAFERRELEFFTALRHLNRTKAFAATLASLRTLEWTVYAKETFAGPEQVLAYLTRYTHRVAIANNRLLKLDEAHVSFRWNKYRSGGRLESKVMRIEAAEFMRRFLLHVLPSGLHRIRQYGFLANRHRAGKLGLCRAVFAVPFEPLDTQNDREREPRSSNRESPPCACCGGRMEIIESFYGSIFRAYPARRPGRLIAGSYRACSISNGHANDPLGAWA